MVSGFKLEAVVFVAVLFILPFLLFYAGKYLDTILSSINPKLSFIVKAFLIAIILCIIILPRESMFQKFSDAITITTTDVQKENKLLPLFTPKNELSASAPSPKNINIIGKF